MKRIVIITLTIALLGSAKAQNYSEKIQQIAQRSLEIKALRAQFTVDSLEFRRGLNPEDPEVDLEYFFDNNAEAVLSQSLDFPTVFIHRNKLSKLGIARSEIEFRAAHRELMIQISEKFIELTYHKKVVKLLSERAGRLGEYVAKIEKGLALGENTRLDLESAQTLKKQMQTELNLAISAQKQCETTLKKWGYSNQNHPTHYPSFIAIDRSEFIKSAISQDLSLEAVRTDSLIALRMVKLSRNEWLPKIKIGYKMAFEGSSTRGGVVAGLSIPLWQNRGNVKHSKALVESAQAQNYATQIAIQTSLENLYLAYEATETSLKAYPNDNRPYIELLKKSLDNGAITYSEFLLSVIDRYAVQQRYLELEMESAQNRAMMEILIN